MLVFRRSAPKETRDKANLMTSEKKLRQELEETRNELKKVQNYVKTQRKRGNEDEVSPVLRQATSPSSFFFRVKTGCAPFKT